MHYSAIVDVHGGVPADRVLQHQSKLLDCGAKIERFRLAPTQLDSDEEALAEHPLMVQSIVRLVPCEGARMDSELQDLLSKVIEKHVTQVFHLLFDVRLPLEALAGRL